MITMLSIIVVAFFSSVRSEQATTRAYLNLNRAEFAADAGVQMAMATMRGFFEACPDSVTLWGALPDADGALLTEGTFLYDAATGRHHPLFSGASGQPAAMLADAVQLVDPEAPFEAPDNSVDLNRPRFPGDGIGWIGSPTQDERKVIRAPWVEMSDPARPDRVTARYAFWIEDESFRYHLNEVGSVRRRQGEGRRPSEIPLQALLEALGEETPDATAAAWLAWRDRFPGGRLLDPRSLNHLDGQRPLAERTRFYTTLYSGALNLSRSGAARLNLNAAVSDSLDPATIRTELDRIIAAIRHQLPFFGERFYRLGADLNAREVAASHQSIYLEKLAANLRDYIDGDSQPTIIRADRSVALGVKPTEAIALEGPPQQGEEHGGENPVLAIGKENVPYLQEFVCRVKLNKFSPVKGPQKVTSSEFDFHLDYYFEFWNLSARDITMADLGPEPFLRIAHQPAFDTGGGTEIPEGRPIEIPLPSDLVFPAGRATVLTTDPSPPPALLSRGPSLSPAEDETPQESPWLITLPVEESARRYTGTTRNKVTSGHFRVNLIPRHTNTTDYGTQVVLGNQFGILESFAALPLVRGDSSGNNALSLHNDDEGDPEKDTILNHGEFFIRGGSLHGNLDQSQTGDPRSSYEQLYLRFYAPEGDDEQTRFYQSKLGNRQVPAKSSLGAFNAEYVDPTSWPDPFPMSLTGANTPMVVADGPMHSIGELGHLYDPARGLGPSKEITYSRGGGRTLAIGQPDPLWDGDPASLSRQWAAWRLCDIFSTDAAMELPARINVNGVHRDGGTAFRALLHGLELTHGPQADPALAGQPLPRSTVETIVAGISDRLQEGPFLERGELSQALAFRPGFVGTAAPQSLYDRGREELFRRIAELVTTRGSVFSVYAIGQAIVETPGGGKRVRATARLRITFELVPEWNPPLDDAFDPGNEAAVAARFRKPDRFRVRVLQATL